MNSNLHKIVVSLLLLIGSSVFAAAQQKELIVAADGSGEFKTVSADIEKVTNNNSSRIVIRIRAGM